MAEATGAVPASSGLLRAAARGTARSPPPSSPRRRGCSPACMRCVGLSGSAAIRISICSRACACWCGRSAQARSRGEPRGSRATPASTASSSVAASFENSFWCATMRQHAQRLDVVGHALQVGSNQVLGLAQVAVGKHAAGRDHLGGEGGELGDVLRRVRGLLLCARPSRRAMPAFASSPAGPGSTRRRARTPGWPPAPAAGRRSNGRAPGTAAGRSDAGPRGCSSVASASGTRCRWRSATARM